jgi:hypothetical protein
LEGSDLALLRRGPLVRTTVDIYAAGGRVAVDVTAAPGRWPERELQDRLVVPVGLAALSLARSQAGVIETVRARLQSAAGSVAAEADPLAYDAAGWCAAVAGLALVEGGEPGQPRIGAQLVRSAVGPVPTIGRASPGALALGIAATAALAVYTQPVDAAGRLATALALEGVLGWYREADPHLQPPQQAVAYALRHAAARLEEADRVAPPELLAAVREHRKINPMAGGA